jgi:hypothetical protein
MDDRPLGYYAVIGLGVSRIRTSPNSVDPKLEQIGSLGGLLSLYVTTCVLEVSMSLHHCCRHFNRKQTIPTLKT